MSMDCLAHCINYLNRTRTTSRHTQERKCECSVWLSMMNLQSRPPQPTRRWHSIADIKLGDRRYKAPDQGRNRKFSQVTNSLGVLLFTDALIMIIWPENNRNVACIHQTFEFSATQQQEATKRWAEIISVPWNDFACTGFIYS